MANDIVWQDYNPYPKSSQFPKEFVFVDKGEGNNEPFGSQSNISSGLQQILFPFPGAATKLNASPMKFTPLAITGEKTGTVPMAEVMQMTPWGPRGLNENRRLLPTFSQYVLAAEIQGIIKHSQSPAKEPAEKQARC